MLLWHRDRAAEDVDEEHHEHDRLERREDEQVGDPLDLDQVALGDDVAVAHGGQGAHRDTASSLVGFVELVAGVLPSESSSAA